MTKLFASDKLSEMEELKKKLQEELAQMGVQIEDEHFESPDELKKKLDSVQTEEGEIKDGEPDGSEVTVEKTPAMEAPPAQGPMPFPTPTLSNAVPLQDSSAPFGGYPPPAPTPSVHPFPTGGIPNTFAPPFQDSPNFQRIEGVYNNHFIPEQRRHVGHHQPPFMRAAYPPRMRPPAGFPHRPSIPPYAQPGFRPPPLAMPFSVPPPGYHSGRPLPMDVPPPPVPPQLPLDGRVAVSAEVPQSSSPNQVSADKDSAKSADKKIEKDPQALASKDSTSQKPAIVLDAADSGLDNISSPEAAPSDNVADEKETSNVATTNTASSLYSNMKRSLNARKKLSKDEIKAMINKKAGDAEPEPKEKEPSLPVASEPPAASDADEWFASLQGMWGAGENIAGESRTNKGGYTLAVKGSNNQQANPRRKKKPRKLNHENELRKVKLHHEFQIVIFYVFALMRFFSAL